VTDADLQRIADELGEPIEIVREMSDAIACCADEGNVEARADRRQRAREAGLDAYADVVAVPDPAGRLDNALDDAIEVATRVRVDADVTQAVREAHPEIMIKTTELKSMIEVAFAAAGFEVEQ
jgi:hypothetical protein